MSIDIKKKIDDCIMNVIKTRIMLIVVCIIVLILTVNVVFSITTIRDIGINNSDRTLFLLCKTGEKNLNTYFDGVEHSVKMVSAYIESDLKELKPEDFSKHLERAKAFFARMANNTNGCLTYYYRIDPAVFPTDKGFWYVNLDGNGFQEHEVTDITLYDTENTSKLVWFTVPKATKKPIWLPPYITDNLGVRVISYNVPIYWQDRFIGVIGIEIDYTAMAREVNNITLYDNGYAFLNDSKGKLVYHPRMDVTAMKVQPDVPYGIISDKNKVNYVFEGVEKIATWLPLNNGMRFNVTVPLSEINSSWIKGCYFIVSFTIAKFVFLCLIFIYIRHLLQIHKQTEDEKQLLEIHQKELDSMITALASDYSSVYRIDIDADEAFCYRSDSNKQNQSPQGEHFPYHAWIEEYCKLYVDEKYKNGFLNFINPDNVSSELLNKNIISYRYLVKRNGTDSYEMLRMANVYRQSERKERVIHAIALGFVDIDAEMRETLAKNQALSEALSIAEHANRAKTAFLANMSHELRTPMNAIISLNSFALNEVAASNKIKDYLVKVDTSAHYLLNIVNEILDMTNIESGDMIIKNEEFSFADILKQINAIASGQCKDKDLHYECLVHGKIDDYYVGDAMKLKQVIINVIGNSIKFTPNGGSIKFVVEEVMRSNHRATIRLIVSDTGIGMSKEYLPHIYDRFSCEDSSYSNKFGKVGLGMSITKSIVDLMNGQIEVESEKGVGTTFKITVTLGEAERESKGLTDANLKSEETNDLSALKGCRVLLAEDIAVNAQIVVMILNAYKIEVEIAENGKIAVDMFNNHPEGYYDAILMDIRMPEMDGLEATRNIRASEHANAKTIPIIALTANAFEEDVQHSMQAGLNVHLSKPINPQVLLKTLNDFIKNR